jgi:hypothetical protein
MRFTTREAWQVIGAGAIAGFALAIVSIAIAAAAGRDPDLPFRIFHSLWFGDLSFRQSAGGPPRDYDIQIVGSVVHLGMSVLTGVGFALIATALRSRRPVVADSKRPSLEALAMLGIAYGLALYVINFQLLGRVLYPWLLELPQPAIAALHAFAYGLPLGLVYGLFEARYSRVYRLGPVAR